MKIIKIIFAVIFLISIQLSAQVSVIVNKSVVETIDKSKVGSIFSLTTTKWSDGSKIVVIDNSSDAKSSFYSGISKDQLSIKKEWMKKQLTGEAKAPQTLGSDEEVITKVNSTPGAIGFVKSSSVAGKAKVLLEIK